MAKRRNWLRAILTVNGEDIQLAYELDDVRVCVVRFDSVAEAVCFRELINNLPDIPTKVGVLSKDPSGWFKTTLQGIERRAKGIRKGAQKVSKGRVSESEILKLKEKIKQKA